MESSMTYFGFFPYVKGPVEDGSAFLQVWNQTVGAQDSPSRPIGGHRAICVYLTSHNAMHIS